MQNKNSTKCSKKVDENMPILIEIMDYIDDEGRSYIDAIQCGWTRKLIVIKKRRVCWRYIFASVVDDYGRLLIELIVCQFSYVYYEKVTAFVE